MQFNKNQKFHLKIITFSIFIAYSISNGYALDLAQSPPGSKEPYVRPNVIISVDDSGSMNFKLNSTAAGSNTIIRPNTDGKWSNDAKRMTVLKYSLESIFDTTHEKFDSSLMPDKKIRLAWQVLHNNGNSSNAANVNSSSMNINSMRVLEGNHRDNFISFVKRLSPNGGTPTHKMFMQADQYMRRSLSKNSPWSSEPGVSTEYLGCRRNYHIVMTDGRWNNYSTSYSPSFNDDNTINHTLPDGNRYGSSTLNNRPYNNIYHDSTSNTLSDWAFKSWANQLQNPTDLKGRIQPDINYRTAPQTENFGNDSTGKAAVLDRYWNPKYNPATWPHMVTYTIGFSSDAITWPGANSIFAPTEKLPFGYNGSFPDLVTGNKSWPTMGNENRRALDMWHAALNGRGRFYAVEKGEDLAKAFRDIFQQINIQTEPETTSSATSGSNITRTEVGQFIAAYEPQNAWKGFLTAQTITPSGQTITAWGGQNTAQLLENKSANDRYILSWSDKLIGNKEQGGIEFRWSSNDDYLSNSQKQKFKSASTEADSKISERINYIRGDRSKEGRDVVGGYTSDKPYRERHSKQGDIVNSDVWYLGNIQSNYLHKNFQNFVKNQKNRIPMLYVGGNDGMLHGFNATSGEELIAYVPKGVISRLHYLTDKSFNSHHKYYVDGSAMSGEVDIATPTNPADVISHTPNWKSILVGSLGAGGKGYFALDVTNPNTFKTTSPATLVRLDRTRSTEEGERSCATTDTLCAQLKQEEADIGHITAKPTLDPANSMRANQITRLNNNRWAVVMGNGYNSANQRAVLLIQYLDGEQELVRISTSNDARGTGLANDNGLSAPNLVDINGDGRADIAYAGDNLGNLWKFDLTSSSPSNWKVAFNESPLFTAKGPAALSNPERNKTQPISTAPIVRANNRKMLIGSGGSQRLVDVGGMMIAFGTGRNLEQADADGFDVQTIYSVLDHTRYLTDGTRVKVHPGQGTCTPYRTIGCIPTPQALGTGVTSAKLAEQKISETNTKFDSLTSINELNENSWNNYNGWYLDLPAIGERVLKPMQFFDGSNILAIYSQVPAKGSDADPNIESCEAPVVDEERQFLTFINIIDGKRSNTSIFDTNADNVFDSTDLFASRSQVPKGARNLITQGNRILDFGTKTGDREERGRMPISALRPSWRQFN